MNKGVTSIEHADFDGVERLAMHRRRDLLGFRQRLRTSSTCDLVEEIMIGEDKLIKFNVAKVRRADRPARRVVARAR